MRSRGTYFPKKTEKVEKKSPPEVQNGDCGACRAIFLCFWGVLVFSLKNVSILGGQRGAGGGEQLIRKGAAAGETPPIDELSIVDCRTSVDVSLKFS